jgi:hypothetical protein
MISFIVPSLILAAIAAGLVFALVEKPPPAGAESLAGASASACNSAQLYWRDIAQARDWDGLKAQLRRWQQVANPGWDEAQVDDVARALNAAVFRFAEPQSGRA